MDYVFLALLNVINAILQNYQVAYNVTWDSIPKNQATILKILDVKDALIIA